MTDSTTPLPNNLKNSWVGQYPKGIPPTITFDPKQHVADLLMATCDAYDQQVAFEQMGTGFTFQQVKQNAILLSAYFQHIGLNKGDRIAIQLPNTIQYPVISLAAWHAGLVVVGINPLYTPPEVHYQLKDSGAKAIVLLENFASALEQAIALDTTGDLALKHIILSGFADFFPYFKRTALHFVIRYLKFMVPRYHLPTAVHLRKALNMAEKLEFIPPSLSGKDIALLQYTGGTTGRSKGAVLTHSNLIANITQVDVWLKNTLSPGKEIVVTALPLYHIFALTVNFLVLFQLGAKNILIANARDIGGMLKQIATSRFTTFTGVNTLFNAMLNHKLFPKVDCSALKMCVAGGMALQDQVATQWEKATNSLLVEGYGLSETSPVVSVNPLNENRRIGSIGLPLPSTQICILDDDNKERSVGEVGELCVQGPQVMREYWQTKEETQRAFIQGYFRTGDLAFQDEAGFFHIVDRKKDIIVVSGLKAYPNEVEAVLAKHKQIKEVGVVGVPDARAGEAVCAFVVRQDDALLIKNNLITYAKECLAPYKRPKHYVFVEELPKTNVGKVLRRALQDQWKSMQPPR